MTSSAREGARGFSLIELVVALALTLLLLGGVFMALNPAEGAFMVEPEVADAQQRLRVAVDTLSRSLRSAGAGAQQGRLAGPLVDSFAPVLPLRQGRRSPDPPGTFSPDTLTVLSVTHGAAQTTLAAPMPAQSGIAVINLDSGCPPGDTACGFSTGMDVAIYDGSGSYDTFTVLAVQSGALTLQHNMIDVGMSYGIGSKVAEVVSRTFYLKSNVSAGTFQLIQYDGAGGADVPVTDDVVGLAFEYFGDPEPPYLRRALTDPVGPWTSYGPAPPQAGVQRSAYPAGENCVFTLNAGGNVIPRLPVLAPNADTLVSLSGSQLTDGPWCPDASNANRFDADLLRVRRVDVRIRVQAANAAVRGPAGLLFARGGTSTSGRRFVPDQELRFSVAPRNLGLTR